MKTKPTTLRDILDQMAYNLEWIFPDIKGSPRIDREKQNTIIDQAPKKLEELLLECKPEKKTKKDVPDPYEVGIHATIPVAQASGYNQALDQWEQAILELMK